MQSIIQQCPACSSELAVTRLSCTRCETEITGRFSTNLFNRLSPENLAFVETFVRLRGNIKEMERELGVPYSAVRNRLDDVIQELGFEDTSPEPEPNEDLGTKRREILDRLDQGEINAAEAADLLSGLK